MKILRIRMGPVVFGALLLAMPLTASGQLVPGVDRGDYWGVQRARARSEALEDFNEVMEEWRAAWDADDVEGLLQIWAEDGVLALSDTEQWGGHQIRTVLEEALPGAGPIQYGLIDFLVSGELVYAMTSFRYARSGGGPMPERVEGQLVTILVKQGRDWRIRSQVFREIPAD